MSFTGCVGGRDGSRRRALEARSPEKWRFGALARQAQWARSMIPPAETPTPSSTPSPPPPAFDPEGLFHRWFVEYNPAYLASAALVLAGLTMMSFDLASAEHGALALAGISELYALSLIFGVFLLRRLGQRRVAVMLALLVMVWQCDLTMFLESSAFRPELGVRAALLWAGLFLLKLRLMGGALELKISRSSYAVAGFGALGVALLPQLFRTGLMSRSELVAIFVFLLSAAALYMPRAIESAVGFDVRGRRAVMGGWALLATGLAFHLADWQAELGVHLGVLVFVALILALRFAPNGVTCVVLVLLALGATFAIEDVSGHLVLVLLMSALVLRAVRGPASASGERSNPIVSPYRGVEGDEVLPLPRVVEQRFGLVDARLREQLLLSAWALFCLELATPDVGLWTLGIFILGCLFAFALGRRKQALIPIAPPLLLLAAQQGVFTQPSSTWGAIAITLGFASLLGGLFAAWWRETARVARSARAPSVRVTRRLAKYARPHVG